MKVLNGGDLSGRMREKINSFNLKTEREKTEQNRTTVKKQKCYCTATLLSALRPALL